MKAKIDILKYILVIEPIKKNLLLAVNNIKKYNGRAHNWMKTNDPLLIRKFTETGTFFFMKSYYIYLMYQIINRFSQYMIKEEYVYLYKNAGIICLCIAIVGFIICFICYVSIFVHYLYNFTYYNNLPEDTAIKIFIVGNKCFAGFLASWTTFSLMVLSIIA